MGAADGSYDVFISYSSMQREWAETLARNLTAAGRRVFFDQWRLKPGQKWVKSLHDGASLSRAAVLVASPEAQASGWVQEEYDKLKRREVEDPSFRIIPAVHSGPGDDFPFLGGIQWVDFRAPHDYAVSFRRLLCGLDDEEPGPDRAYAGPLELPPTGTTPRAKPRPERAAQAYDALFATRVVLVLAREAMGGSGAIEDVRMRLAANGGASLIHLTLPLVPDDGDPAEFYRELARQAGFAGDIDGGVDFQAAVDERARDGETLILVSRFEHASPRDQSDFAKAIRALSEMNGALRTILCGGKRLCELKYAHGDFSLLSNATEVIWPDPGAETIAGRLGRPQEEEAAIVELSGEHPALARDVAGRAPALASDGAFYEALKRSASLWAVLSPMAQHPDMREQLCACIGKTDLGPNNPYQKDDVLRELYWKGLIGAADDDPFARLRWRSDAIRRAAAEIVACL